MITISNFDWTRFECAPKVSHTLWGAQNTMTAWMCAAPDSDAGELLGGDVQVGAPMDVTNSTDQKTKG
jgi:hypothetical protein